MQLRRIYLMIASLILLVGSSITGAYFLASVLKEDGASLLSDSVRFGFWWGLFVFHFGLFLWFTSEKNFTK